MSNKKEKKYQRLQDRLRELRELEEKLFKLQFFLNETPIDEIEGADLLKQQAEIMGKYKYILEERMLRGIY